MTRKKKMKTVFNENTDLFWDQKKFRSVYNENTNQFWVFKKWFWWSLVDFEIKEKFKTNNQLKNMSMKISTKYLSMTNMN